ncbi:MAG: putative transport system, permease component [Verrucomicrobiales bacterium]|nr:putative transport system, permease component [Verrucomicrobiales bacterium]
MINNALAVAGIVIKELYRRKDFYVLFVLTALITLLLGCVNFFNDDRIARYLKEICLLLIWISSLIIAVTTTARQIPAERENRTIFPLLAKPLTRGHLVFGKFLGCWFASGLSLVVFYFFFCVVSGAREHQWPLLIYLQALWLHWILLALVVAMVLLGSIMFAAPSSNSTICFIFIVGILLVGRHLHRIAIQLQEPIRTIVSVIYFAIPHLEFYDIREMIVHNLPPISMLACLIATVYAIGYTAFFLIATWLVFRRKSLTA